MNYLIGISGKKNSGKDLVADYIISTMFLKKKILMEKRKFADKLKDMVCMLLNCSREQLEDREFKEKELGKEWWYWKNKHTDAKYIPFNEEYIYSEHFDLIKLTPRLLLQLLGTECGRDIIHPNIWVNATMAEYKPLMTRHTELIDLSKNTREKVSKDYPLKYPNWVISDVRFKNEAKAIKDKGGILIRVDRPGFEETGQHLSETALDDYDGFDHIIMNDGTVEDLFTKIDKCLNIK